MQLYIFEEFNLQFPTQVREAEQLLSFALELQAYRHQNKSKLGQVQEQNKSKGTGQMQEGANDISKTNQMRERNDALKVEQINQTNNASQSEQTDIADNPNQTKQNKKIANVDNEKVVKSSRKKKDKNSKKKEGIMKLKEEERVSQDFFEVDMRLIKDKKNLAVKIESIKWWDMYQVRTNFVLCFFRCLIWEITNLRIVLPFIIIYVPCNKH